jgi:hypothetical protein
MNPKVSDEQREAIRTSHGRPVEVEDDRTQSLYVLVARDDFQRLVEERLRRELQIAFDQAAAGEVDDWNIEEMLDAARRLGPSGGS